MVQSGPIPFISPISRAEVVRKLPESNPECGSLGWLVTLCSFGQLYLTFMSPGTCRAQCSTSVQDSLVIIHCLEEGLEHIGRSQAVDWGGRYWTRGSQHSVFDILGAGGDWAELDLSGHRQEN